MVGSAGSAGLYAVHNLPFVSPFLVFSFSLVFSIVHLPQFGSNRCNSFVLNFTLVFLSYEPCAHLSPLFLLRIQSIPKP